jgi:hypothetical protein
MASPFRLFRKNVKPLIVVFMSLLVLAWVAGGGLTPRMSGPREGADSSRDVNAVAVTWDGGSLTNQQIGDLVQRRRIANDFQRQIEGLGRQSAFMAGLEPSRLRVQPLLGPETPEQGVERSVVQTRLFAEAAREAGMTVSDQTIVEYLLDLGRRRVTKEDMRAILAQSGHGASIEYVFDALREEMLANNYFGSYFYAFRTVSPQQNWQDWLRVNDRVVIEAAALPVESYLIEVKDPTEAELVAFFDEYKEKQPGLDFVENTELPSARPGFGTPRKIALQYVEASAEDMMNKAEAEVTDEEIAKYYDQNKDQFIQADTGLIDDTTESESAPAGETTNPQPPAEGATNEPPAEAAPAETGSETPAAAQSPAPPATEDGTEGSTPPAESADESQPAAPADPPPASEVDEKAPAEGDQSSRNFGPSNVFRQVAFLQETKDQSAEAAAQEEPASSSTPATEAPATTESAPAEEPTDESEAPATDAPPATTDPAATPSSTDASPPTADAPPAASETSPPTDAAASPPASPPAADKPVKYQPLEEVRDVIRRELATRRMIDNAAKQMDEIMGELSGEFNTYFGAVLEAQANEKEPPAPQAALADLEPLAKKYGLTYHKTDPMSSLELSDSPVGKSGNPETGVGLTYRLFRIDDLELYQPALTVDIDGNRYIVMKTSDAPGRVPELKDIRDEVVRAWKLREAAKFALKDAEKQAKAANESTTSLTDFFAGKPDVEVVKVDPFSELTRGDVPDQSGVQRFRLSQPDGLVTPGPEFFKRTFELKDGEVGAALNNDHTIAYVIRLVEHQNSQDELRTAYLSEAGNWDGLLAMMERRLGQSQQALVDDLSGGSLDWKRDPDPIGKDEN